MTAIQILEKLGANASFNPNQLSEEDKSAIQQTLSDSEPFNAILINTQPEDDEETPDDSEDEEQPDSEK